MKTLAVLLVLLAVGLFAFPSFAQETLPTQTTWGALKVRYRAESSQPQAAGSNRAIAKPGAEMNAASYSVRVKPYFVNEFWRDPNNPASGVHVVMFFRFNTNMSRSVKLRLYQGNECGWLNDWRYWVRYPAPGVQEVMLFADGHFWWPQRFFYSPWTVSQRFELCL